MTWLPVDMAANGAPAVSATSTRTFSGETPKVSAAMSARPVAVPLMSGEPTVIARVPSGSTQQPAADGVRAPPHMPSAIPTASPSDTGAL